MRKVIPALVITAIVSTASATARAEDPKLVAARDRYMRDRIGLMAGLTAWAGLNVIGGTALWITAPSDPKDPAARPFRRSFAAMSAGYGLVNGIIGIATLATLGKTRAGLTSPGVIAEQRRQSADIFAINVGLDILSVGIGAAIWAYGPPGNAKGAGAGVTAQGLFLVGFDAIGSAVYRY